MLVAGPASGTSASARRYGLQTGYPSSTLTSGCPPSGAASVRYRTQAVRRGRCGEWPSGDTAAWALRVFRGNRRRRRQPDEESMDQPRMREQRQLARWGSGRARCTHALHRHSRATLPGQEKAPLKWAGSAATRSGAGFGDEPGRANQEGAPGRGRWTRQGHRCAPHRPRSQSLPLYIGPRARRRLYGTAHGVRRDAPYRSPGGGDLVAAGRRPREGPPADPSRGAPPGSLNRPQSVR